MKRYLSLLLALVIALSVEVPAFAETFGVLDGSDVEIINIEPGESTRAEETCWCYRVHNGMLQTRLWSITYRKWLTDWIDVGPYIGG